MLLSRRFPPRLRWKADRLLWQWMCRTTDNADDATGRVEQRAARTRPNLLNEIYIAHDSSARFWCHDAACLLRKLLILGKPVTYFSS